MREGISALQDEMLGYYKDTVRGNFGVSGPDFKVVGLGKFSHITLLISRSKIQLVQQSKKLVEMQVIFFSKMKILGEKL